MDKKEIITLMLQQQEKLNNNICIEWRKKNFPWYRAIIMECAELMDCFPWKWWSDKNKEIDFDNVKIEVVDIWHFILSWIIETNNYDLLIYCLSKVYDSRRKMYKNILFYIDHIIYHSIIEDLHFVLIYFFKLLKLCNISFEELAKIYFGKNILNRFRQNNGIKQGEYKRVWDGIEDNKVMLNMINAIKLLPLEEFEKNLWNKLNNYYNNIK